MKTIYLVKSLLPFIFLPIAPGVIQLQLERMGLLNHGSMTPLTFLLQIAFSAVIVLLVIQKINRASGVPSFLKMSCISKKVFHKDKWISVEQYLADFHNITVSHGMTPEESTAWLQESEAWLIHENGSKRHTASLDRVEASESIAIAK